MTETPPQDITPKTEISPDRDLLEGTWDQAARQEVTSYRDPPLDRQMPVKILPCPKIRLRVGKYVGLLLCRNILKTRRPY